MSQPANSSTRDDFPFATSISLDPLVRLIEARAEDTASPWQPMAKAILVEIEEAPQIRGKPSAIELARHEPLIARMMTMVFPGAGRDDVIGAALEPYRMDPATLYQTDEAKRLNLFTLDNLIQNANMPPDLMKAGMAMSAYQWVLQRCYGAHSNPEPDLVITIADDAGLRRHLQLAWIADFLEVEVKGDLPELSEQDLAVIQGDPLNIEQVTRLLPPDQFELTGFGVVTATDVTPREVVSRLKNDLIHKDALTAPDRANLVQTRIRNLVRSPDAVVGFIAFDESAEIDNIQRARAVGRSLLFDAGSAPACPMKGESTYAEALANRQPVVLQDISGDNIKTGYEAHLAGLGFKSFVLCPLVMDDKLIGLMEIGSPTAGALNAFSAMLLIDVAPLFTVAIQRTVEEKSDRIEAVIKKRYTSIHPSVEWRFKRAALELMEAEAGGNDVELPEIVFDQVYPLYGLSDIRGSSARRHTAIRSDLVRQLELALAAVQAGSVSQPLLVMDELAHKIRGYIAGANEDSGTEDEQIALGFLSKEVEPLLDRVAEMSEGAKARVEAYRESLDSKLGVVYDQRRAFEDSVSAINGLVSRLIDEDNETAQSTVPHLFERFKTDGVDYNLYVGETISEGGAFHPLLLKELRLRQLALHCRIEWEARAQLPTLEVPMELTHLVLVQDIPLSIRFRTDEKRFDVDGAYNIRYEIVKKRIDKATVRGSGERLTQPGMLAVVYSHAHEAAEYRRYLKYLADVGYVDDLVEELEIEDLQGVYGLKALRAKVAETQPALLPKNVELPANEVPKAVRDRIRQGTAELSRS